MIYADEGNISDSDTTVSHDSIAGKMKTILYVAASQYSGSPLASFLLNTHPDVTTVGHTMGWHFGPNDDFRCSCGDPLDKCRFYRHIANAFAENNLRFDIRDFGTEIRLSSNDRLNRYLTASLPLIQSNKLEQFRDHIVSAFSGYSSRMDRQLYANSIFMTAAMNYSGAKVYVDNSHDPYRLRHLNKISSLALQSIHLVRDPRGVALSCMKHANWKPALATRLWVRRQSDILRISNELSSQSLLVYYEDLCTDCDRTLQKIHRFSNIDAIPFSGSFNKTEHHILGNDMRLKSGTVQLDERWKRELSTGDLKSITSLLLHEADRAADKRLGEIVDHYLCNH